MYYKAPRVSIGLPVYNGENFLIEALQSLLAQTYKNFELIISDNASTDRTPDICRSYADHDRRIRYYRQEENRGAAWNYNRVFELSRGKYFKWAAHDDICSPTFLGHCVEVLDHYPDVVWCHSKSTHIDPNGRPLVAPYGGDISYTTVNPYDLACQYMTQTERKGSRPTRESKHAHQRFRSVLLGTGNLDVFGLMRADAMRKTRLQRPYYGGDKVFIAELSLLGRFKEIPETLFFSRVHPEGSGARKSVAQQQEFINPKGPRRFAFTRLKLLKAHVCAVLRADLGIRDRTRCFIVILLYLLQHRKWKHIVRRTFTRAGTGRGYLDVVEMLEKPKSGESINRPPANTVH